jgi:hypothetical protein
MLIQTSSRVDIRDSKRYFEDTLRKHLESSTAYVAGMNEQLPLDPAELRKTEKGWEFAFEWDALQPQRIRFIRPYLFVVTEEDASVQFTARVFADSFPEPVVFELAARITSSH